MFLLSTLAFFFVSPYDEQLTLNVENKRFIFETGFSSFNRMFFKSTAPQSQLLSMELLLLRFKDLEWNQQQYVGYLINLVSINEEDFSEELIEFYRKNLTDKRIESLVKYAKSSFFEGDVEKVAKILGLLQNSPM